MTLALLEEIVRRAYMISVSTSFREGDVVHLTSGDHGFSGPRAGVKLQAIDFVSTESRSAKSRGKTSSLQGVFEVFVNLHDGGLVTASVTVVGRCGAKLAGWSSGMRRSMD
jgi:hypothetical protein